MSSNRNSNGGQFPYDFDNPDQKNHDLAEYGRRKRNRFIPHHPNHRPAYGAQSMQQPLPNQPPLFYVPMMPMQVPAMMPERMMQPFVRMQQQNFQPTPPSDQASTPRRSVADFNSCLIARKQEEKIRKLEQKCAEMKREKEESSKYSIKKVSIASDSEADECPPLASSPHKHRKRRKSHRHNSHKSKKGHNKSKRRRRSCSSSSSSSSSRSSSVEILGSRQNGHKDIKVENMFDVKSNPWKLLSSSEYGYKTTHLVVETEGDPKNLLYGRSYKSEIASHKSLSGALSNLFGAIGFIEAVVSVRDPRYFDLLSKGREENQQVERVFYHRKPLGTVNVEPIPISHEKYTPKEEIVTTCVAKMNPDDYDDYVKSKFLSWEEAGLEEKRILLATRINIEPNDVDACIKFVRLQDQLMAFKESGIAAAEVRNKRALYQIKQSIISKSLRSNRSSIALRLEMLDVAEACYGFNSDEFSDMEGRLINEFPNNIVMWEALLRKRQNKLANFESTEMLGMIDRCLSNMLRYRGNGLNSEAATDDFLVSLVVYRCKLLIECGFADQAVASLQALTEFHFFPLMDQSLVDEKFVDKFKNFWTQGIPRIGDDGSLGWSRSKTNALAPSEECADLQKELLKIRKKEELILATCSQKTGVTAEIWRQLETFRNQASWRPVRSPGTPHELYEFASRKVSFEEVRPLLFPFSDKSCAEYLVFKILQLFGAVIPGMKDDSHEGILRRLSSDLFPSCSLRYESMSEFLDKFLLLLSSAEEADVVRILSARELTYAHLQLSGPDLDAGAREKAVNLRKRTLESVDNINEAENLAITFYMLKSYENSGDRAGSLKLFKFLSMVFSALSSCIWSIQSLRDRLIYLRMAKAFCRRLPAAADQLSPGAPKTLTKKSFLLRLGVQGNARELTNELEQKDRAWNSWMACLKDSANSAHSKFDWLANEAEIILELAAAFFSEVTDGGLMKKWKVFDRAATESPLAKSLKDRPAVQKLRCKFYSNEVKKSKAFSPKLLLRLLKDGMETFSDEIYFVKKFIELSHHFDAVVYLKINPGISWLQRRIRCSALLVLGLKKYAQEGQNPARILQEVISIAVREENKLVLPDAYLWCWLLSHDAVKKSARGMEEAFALAREHCPWSKQLILESIKTRGLFKEILPETAKMFYSSGLQMYWDPDEISRQLVL